jgi:predicted phage terminase large subunit-like protein
MPWHPDDMCIRLAKKANWCSRTWKALLSEQEGKVLWPEQWPLQRLLAKKRDIGPLAFAQQYQCEPYDPEDTALPAIRYWDRKQLGGSVGNWTMDGRRMKLVTGVDPNIKKREERDRMAIVTVGMVVGTGRKYVLEVRGGHWSFWKGVEEIRETWRRWGPEAVLIETNLFAESYRETLARFTSIPVYGVESMTDKHQRIVTWLHPAASNGNLWFLPDQEALIEEWVTFPGEHDDYLDGLQFAVKELGEQSERGYSAASVVARAKAALGAGVAGGIRSDYDG